MTEKAVLLEDLDHLRDRLNRHQVLLERLADVLSKALEQRASIVRDLEAVALAVEAIDEQARSEFDR
jgi:hypothetical protein